MEVVTFVLAPFSPLLGLIILVLILAYLLDYI